MVGEINIDVATAGTPDCAAGSTLFWGIARNTGDLDVDDVFIEIDALNAGNGVLGTYRVNVFNGEVTPATEATDDDRGHDPDCRHQSRRGSVGDLHGLRPAERRRRGGHRLPHRFHRRQRDRVMVNGRRVAFACLGVMVCGFAACAAVSDRRAQDADAHFRMATASLQQPGGIQSEVNRRVAYPELTLAIKFNPKNALYHHTLGTLYLYNQDLPAAERETLLALKLDPGFAEGHNSLGLIYLSQGKISEAAAEFRKALENLSYTTPEYAAYNLGKAAYQLKDFAVAAESYERSLAILPNNPEARFELGMSYTQLGRLADAERAFTAALKLRPDVARTRYELGMVLFKLGRRSEAVEQFRRVVELDPTGEFGEQSRTYLRLLK